MGNHVTTLSDLEGRPGSVAPGRNLEVTDMCIGRQLENLGCAFAQSQRPPIMVAKGAELQISKSVAILTDDVEPGRNIP